MIKNNKIIKNGVRHLITKINPKSVISEQYRTLRSNVQFSSLHEKVKSLLITSPDPLAGKSMTTANLAIVYAQQGIKTLIIDADMRKPSMHFKFGLDNLSGLSNALTLESASINIAKKSEVANLDVIPSGPVPSNPSELLASKCFKNLLYEANNRYEMILIDSPPINSVTDAQILATIVGDVIIVARSGQTEAEQLKKSVELIESVNGNLLGIVLNDQEKNASEAHYYYKE